MRFLQEVLAGVRRLDQESNPDDLDLDLDPSDDELSLDDDQDSPDDELSLDDDQDSPDDELSLDDSGDADPELDGVVQDALSDPNYQGLIRTVKDAHLVYKREIEDGTFEELWMYNITALRGMLDVKKAIIAGTDITPSRMQSPDGSQTYEIWSSGNAELILIKGLPS